MEAKKKDSKAGDWKWNAATVLFIISFSLLSGLSRMVREGTLGSGIVWLADWICPVFAAVILILLLVYYWRNRNKS